MLASIEKSKAEAKTDRLVQLETLGKSAQGRDMKMGIVSKDQASIDHYLSSTNPKALTKPSEMLGSSEGQDLGIINYLSLFTIPTPMNNLELILSRDSSVPSQLKIKSALRLRMKPETSRT